MTDEHLSSPQHFQQYLENFGTARIDQVTGVAIFRSMKASGRSPHDNEPRVFFNPKALLEDPSKATERLHGNLDDLLNDLHSLNRKTNQGEKMNAFALFSKNLPQIEGYIRDAVYLVKQMEAENAAQRSDNALRRPWLTVNQEPLKKLSTKLVKVLFELQKLRAVNPETPGIDFESFTPFFEVFDKELTLLQKAAHK